MICVMSDLRMTGKKLLIPLIFSTSEQIHRISPHFTFWKNSVQAYKYLSIHTHPNILACKLSGRTWQSENEQFVYILLSIYYSSSKQYILLRTCNMQHAIKYNLKQSVKFIKLFIAQSTKITKIGENNHTREDAKKLGCLLGTEREISRRKKLAVLAMNKLNHVLKSNLNIKKKTRIYQAYVESVLLYGCQTWGKCKSRLEQLNSFRRRMIQRTCKVKCLQVMKYDKCNQILLLLEEEVKKRQNKISGHMLRHETPAKRQTRLYQTSEEGEADHQPLLRITSSTRVAK